MIMRVRKATRTMNEEIKLTSMENVHCLAPIVGDLFLLYCFYDRKQQSRKVEDRN